MTSTPKRRWFAFRLRTLLVVVLVMGFVLTPLAMKVKKSRDQKKVVAWVLENGGTIEYDWQADDATTPPGPRWLRSIIGDEFFQTVRAVDLGEFTQVGDLGAQVTSEDLVHLKVLRNLESLDLSGTVVTNSGLTYLQDLKKLKELDLSYTHVTPAAVHALRKQSPGLNVVQRWQFMFRSVDGKATIDTTGVTLLFEGIPMRSGSGGGGLPVSGPGSGGVGGYAGWVGFSANYSQGVVTIKIRDYTFKLRNNGAKLAFGKQMFDLSKEKKIIAINPKRVARIVKRTDENEE